MSLRTQPNYPCNITSTIGAAIQGTDDELVKSLRLRKALCHDILRHLVNTWSG
jgi:hypothetical protein